MSTRRHPDAWHTAALSPPRAHGTPLAAAELKARPEDFVVEEQLSFTPSGQGPHWLLRVEKRGANTRWVAAELARLAGVAGHDVGYAGLKDRHAVAAQWFSVPVVAGSSADQWRSLRTEEFRVLDVHANLRKLKRGALTGNRFRIRLRRVSWTRDALERKLAIIREQGVPNYFGPQRFGREGYNLDRLASWVEGQGPKGRTERGFVLSAARSMIFNAALARRVEAGDWSSLAPGDLASLDGSASHFQVAAVDEQLTQRIATFDVHPSGPMWGRGTPRTQGLILQRELEAAADFAAVAALLAAEGLEQERRSLRCAVRELSSEFDADSDSVSLSFALGRGQFATSVLREICELGSASELESDEDA